MSSFSGRHDRTQLYFQSWRGRGRRIIRCSRPASASLQVQGQPDLHKTLCVSPSPPITYQVLLSLGLVVQVCNPRYLGGRGRGIASLRPMWTPVIVSSKLVWIACHDCLRPTVMVRAKGVVACSPSSSKAPGLISGTSKKNHNNKMCWAGSSVGRVLRPGFDPWPLRKFVYSYKGIICLQSRTWKIGK